MSASGWLEITLPARGRGPEQDKERILNLQQIRQAALRASLVALLIAGASFFPTRPVAGQEAKPAALRGAAAIERLKNDGQYESLRAALNRARFDASRAEDSKAAYPLTNDPLFSFKQKLLAADGDASDQFGKAVALSGDTVVIGAYWDEAPHPYQGSVYVFARSGDGWKQQQKLTASDGARDDYFGISVAISDDTLVVGAQFANIVPYADQGAVYVFTRNGSVWTERQKLTASDALPDDNFGASVAISGDTLAVGAPGDDIGANHEQGSVYVFMRSGADWTEKQKLTGAHGATFDHFGSKVALSGDTLVVGAPLANGGAIYQGAVYIYARVGSVWAQQQYLSSGGVEDQFFGSAVAISGDTLMVGARGDQVGANYQQGSVYVYTRSGTDWAYQQRLTADDGKAYDYFGSSIALSDDILVVGANYADIGVNLNQGAAYVFKGGGAVWTQEQKLTAYDGEADDFFAEAVAVSGDTVMVGARIDSIGATPYQGSVYVFSNSTCPPAEGDPQTLPNGAVGAWYSETLTAKGGVAPYTFVAGGGTPPGLSLSAGGLLSGNPTQHGAFSIRVLIRDANGCRQRAAVFITIAKSGVKFSTTTGGKDSGR